MAKCESCQLFGQECSGSQRSLEDCTGVFYQPKPEAQGTSTRLGINGSASSPQDTLEEIMCRCCDGVSAADTCEWRIAGEFCEAVKTTISDIQARYVLLAENQILPENIAEQRCKDWEEKNPMPHGEIPREVPSYYMDDVIKAATYAKAQKDMRTPILNPDGTYRVWMAVNLTKEQLGSGRSRE